MSTTETEITIDKNY